MLCQFLLKLKYLTGLRRLTDVKKEQLRNLIIIEEGAELLERFTTPVANLEGHTEESYSRVHDLLGVEFEKIGSVEGGRLIPEGSFEPEEAFDVEFPDFSMDRFTGPSNPIGIAVETIIPGTITAVLQALSKTDVDYSVSLDIELGQVTVTKSREIA